MDPTPERQGREEEREVWRGLRPRTGEREVRRMSRSPTGEREVWSGSNKPGHCGVGGRRSSRAPTGGLILGTHARGGMKAETKVHSMSIGSG